MTEQAGPQQPGQPPQQYGARPYGDADRTAPTQQPWDPAYYPYAGYQPGVRRTAAVRRRLRPQHAAGAAGAAPAGCARGSPAAPPRSSAPAWPRPASSVSGIGCAGHGGTVERLGLAAVGSSSGSSSGRPAVGLQRRRLGRGGTTHGRRPGGTLPVQRHPVGSGSSAAARHGSTSGTGATASAAAGRRRRHRTPSSATRAPRRPAPAWSSPPTARSSPTTT